MLALLKNFRKQFLIASSYKDYHIKGINYICLYRKPELTIKLYLFRPNQCELNNQGLIVHPHSHLYDFTSHVLLGKINNIVYLPGLKPGAANIIANLFKYLPKTGSIKLAKPRVGMHIIGKEYKQGMSYQVLTNEIHSLSMDTTKYNALLTLQNRTLLKESQIFLPYGANPVLNGVYNKFNSRKEIEDLLVEFEDTYATLTQN